jgi:hypothetical protein
MNQNGCITVTLPNGRVFIIWGITRDLKIVMTDATELCKEESNVSN